MTADDLERRAIIAAHEAECVDQCGEDATTFRKLRTSEKAIVDLWRADREDYQGRYEIAHESFLASERDRDVAEAEAERLRTVTAMAGQAGAAILDERNAAVATIQRVRARCETAGTTQPPFGQPARTLTVAEILAALDGEPTDG